VAADAHLQNPAAEDTRAARLALAATHQDAYTAANLGTFDPGGQTRQGAEAWRRREEQVPLLRDLFGNPFGPVALDPVCRTTAVITLASTIYEQCAFGRLGELADILKATCRMDPALLAHLRSPGPHVRGCHALDLILGKG
jgi:hypothetical protein